MPYLAQYGRCPTGSLQSSGTVDALYGPVWLMPNWFITKSGEGRYHIRHSMVVAQLIHYKVRGRLMSYPAQYG